jgi:hypothetical protein
MLAEFALLPSIFDEKAHPDVAAWKEQLRELAHGMFPRNVGCPVVIADLQDGEWWNHARRIVERRPVGDSRRSDMLRFLAKIKSVMVRRPGHMKKLVNDLDWAREAIWHHESEPFERIVACAATKEELRKESADISELGGVCDELFWQHVSPVLSPPLRIEEQVQTLRRICLHAEFLCLTLPYVQGNDTDETKFAAALIRSAFHRPDGYPMPSVDVHTNAPPRDHNFPSYPDQLRQVTNKFSARFLESLPAAQQVSLIVWQTKEILGRYLLAGSLTQDGSGTARKRPRWGVHMGHVAGGGDARRRRRASSNTDWNLVDERRLWELFEDFAAPGVSGFLQPPTVVGK